MVITLLFFLVLEVITRTLMRNPCEEEPLKQCSKDSYEPYDKQDQCYQSQEEIAKMEFNTFIGYIPASNNNGIGWYTNNDHYRYNENFPDQKPDYEVRIFITGGSTAWGAGVQQDQTFSYLLEKKLNENYKQKKFRVVIAAAGAWASSQEKIFIANYVVDFNPDIIIMFSGWNDIYHAYTGVNYNKEQDFLMYRKAIETYQDLIKVEGRLDYKVQNRFLNLAPPQYNEYSSKLLYLLNKLLYKYNTNHKNISKKLKNIQLSSNQIIQNTMENIDLVNYLSKKHNFYLIYCLQPSIYNTKKKLSDWENKILAYSEKHYVNFKDYNFINYNFLKR